MMKKSNRLLTTCLVILLTVILAGCGPQKSNPITTNPTPTDGPSLAQSTPFSTPHASATEAPTKAAPQEVLPGQTWYLPSLFKDSYATPEAYSPDAQDVVLPPERWQEWPVLPHVSQRAKEIYQAGIAQGNDPTHFSKVGDCQNIHQYFLGLFDDPEEYRLGDQYAYLKGTIDYFSGNWDRLSEAVRTGFNVASVLAPLHANPENCQPGETPLACEIRIWNPSIALISMETWTPDRPTQVYEDYLRQIVEYAISENVLPILATKADNLEGDHSINQIIARVAADYDIPMWNYWAATQPLTNHGLEEDGFHLTNGPNNFADPQSLDLAWPIRNLTGLLAIDTVWKTVR